MINCRVAPFVGAWIEIIMRGGITNAKIVAPFVGTWIVQVFYSIKWYIENGIQDLMENNI